MAWVVFEGPDGVGKSTLIVKLRDELARRGVKVQVTGEPSESPIGRLTREWLLKSQVNPPHIYALIFTADRYWHYYNIVKPALESCTVVLQERYKESTIVYQAAMGLDIEWLEQLNKYLPDPDLTILLDLEVDKLITRLASRGTAEIFEHREFLEKVRDLYLRRAREKGFLVLYADDLEKTFRQALQYVLALLENKRVLREID